jgi:hypothetical protein
MLIDKVLPEAKKHFPKLKIKFKNESVFMKILGLLLFFNNGFMNSYSSTIGSTIYFPSKEVLEKKGYYGFASLFHELVHMWDSKNNKLFKLLYLFPQILIIFTIPLLFIFSWKFVVPFIILFALPLPAYFRMKYEKRAYFVSLYTLYKISKRKKNYNIVLEDFKIGYISNFKNSNYYYMWIFDNINKDFDVAVDKIKNNKKPFDDKIINIVDDLIEKIFI